MFRMTTLSLYAMIAVLSVPAIVFGAGEVGAAEALSETVGANTAFAVDWYQRAAATPGNVFFSPFSVSSALAMTYGGARGETADQMAKVLRFSLDGEPLHAGFGQLTGELAAPSTEYELSIANALWAQQDFAFLDAYTGLIERHYGAALDLLDFQTNTEQARITINRWVESKTKDRIQELIKPGVLNQATRLVLTNAVYFKGLWAVPFNKKNTREEPFFLSASHTKPAQMMHMTDRFGYFDAGSFQILDMPYKGERLSMTILLPKEVEGLAELEDRISVERLREWFANLSKQKVIVTVPRFTITWEARLDKDLAEMGMPLPFTDAADFSGMTGRRDLFLSAVVHKAFVDVNEEGTEAAAATAVGMALTAAPLAPPPEFRADRPFLFMIRDKRTDSLLFMGRLAEPASANPSGKGILSSAP